MVETLKKILCKNRKEWRSWLQKNHSQKGVWLIYFKKHTKKPSVFYNDAVEEAICFGWIDGQAKRIDDEKYMQRYTPRRARSHWSEINIARAKKMIKQGLMTNRGLKIFQERTKNKEKVPSGRNFTQKSPGLKPRSSERLLSLKSERQSPAPSEARSCEPQRRATL